MGTEREPPQIHCRELRSGSCSVSSEQGRKDPAEPPGRPAWRVRDHKRERRHRYRLWEFLSSPHFLPMILTVRLHSSPARCKISSRRARQNPGCVRTKRIFTPKSGSFSLCSSSDESLLPSNQGRGFQCPECELAGFVGSWAGDGLRFNSDVSLSDISAISRLSSPAGKGALGRRRDGFPQEAKPLGLLGSFPPGPGCAHSGALIW